MNRNAETTILIDLDRMPNDIGMLREGTNKLKRIYDDSDVQDVVTWMNTKMKNMPSGADVLVIGTMPTWMSMDIGIQLYKDTRIGRLYQSVHNATPYLVFDRTVGSVA